MTIPATDTAIDIAYWFFNRAEKDGIYLETEKMQHLLFLAQIHFAMAYNMQILVPSLFVCNKDGFFEPNLKRMFAMGRHKRTPHGKHALQVCHGASVYAAGQVSGQDRLFSGKHLEQMRKNIADRPGKAD